MLKLLYITFANKEEAIKTAETLLEEKLIACANIIPGSTSIYRWEGKNARQEEVILLAKTSDKKIEQAVARTRSLHSYVLPSILVLPIESGFVPFMEWVEAETS